MLAGVCVASSLAQAQTLSREVTDRIDGVFQKWDRTDSPGCALGVYKDGQIVYKHGYGMANLNDDVTITPETVFHVASMSKQFVDAAIVLLAQQGKLSLDDDVHKYIPELPDFGQRITIRHLVHHTSGLRDQWELLGFAGWRYSLDLITNDDVMSVVTRQKDLNFRPGDKYEYSNTGYTLLGLIVKQVSGLSLREFTVKNIFEPLGMTHSHFRDDHEEVIKHDALGYEQAGEGEPWRMSLTNFDTVGATSLHTTVEDLQLWDENFYHPRVGGQAFVQQMLEQGKLNSGEQLPYAFALVVGKYRGLTTVDHGGADAGYRSDITRFPDQHFTATVLCNFAAARPSEYVQRVADIVLAKELGPDSASAKPAEEGPDVSIPPEQLTAFAGMYWNSEADDYARIAVKDGHLQWVNPHNGNAIPLKHKGDLHFHAAQGIRGLEMNVHFIPATSSKPVTIEQQSITHALLGEKTNIFEAVPSFEPTVGDLAEYTGAYVSEEIDPVYRLVIQDGNLTLIRAKFPPDAFRPTVRDVFLGNIGTVHFTRDASRHISGLIINGNRIQNFRFSKKAK
jgi:CubicO group peptidase (beta-lactamase class C family)